MNSACQKTTKPVTKFQIYVCLIAFYVTLGGATWWINYFQDNLTQSIGELRLDLRGIGDDIRGIGDDVREIRGDIREIRGDVREIGNDVRGIGDDVREIGGDIREIRSDVREIRCELRGDRNICKDTIREDLIREKNWKSNP